MTEPAFAVPSRSLHFRAAAWGGLVGAIGLMIGLALEPTARHIVVGIAFVCAGSIAATRAPALGLGHALLAAALGYLLFVVFILVATAISRAGGPDAPEFAESGSRSAAITAVWAVGGCVVGGTLVSWLGPGSRRRSSHRRR